MYTHYIYTMAVSKTDHIEFRRNNRHACWKKGRTVKMIPLSNRSQLVQNQYWFAMKSDLYKIDRCLALSSCGKYFLKDDGWYDLKSTSSAKPILTTTEIEMDTTRTAITISANGEGVAAVAATDRSLSTSIKPVDVSLTANPGTGGRIWRLQKYNVGNSLHFELKCLDPERSFGRSEAIVSPPTTTQETSDPTPCSSGCTCSFNNDGSVLGVIHGRSKQISFYRLFALLQSSLTNVFDENDDGVTAFAGDDGVLIQRVTMPYLDLSLSKRIIFSNDGRYAMVASPTRVVAIDIAKGKCLGSLAICTQEFDVLELHHQVRQHGGYMNDLLDKAVLFPSDDMIVLPREVRGSLVSCRLALIDFDLLARTRDELEAIKSSAALRRAVEHEILYDNEPSLPVEHLGLLDWICCHWDVERIQALLERLKSTYSVIQNIHIRETLEAFQA